MGKTVGYEKCHEACNKTWDQILVTKHKTELRFKSTGRFDCPVILKRWFQEKILSSKFKKKMVIYGDREKCDLCCGVCSMYYGINWVRGSPFIVTESVF